MRYYEFWENLKKQPDILLEYISDRPIKSWSGRPVVRHQNYKYPVGEFPRSDAERMVHDNPHAWRYPIYIDEDGKPLIAPKPVIKRGRPPVNMRKVIA